MKCLVIGSGGREHAISWKLAASPRVEHVYVAPGNAGTAGESKVSNIAIDSLDLDALLDFATTEQIGLTLVGPEAPLAAGIVDRFREHGLAIIGPTAAAAQLEASKSFSKHFMQQHGIPTAQASTFTCPIRAKSYLASCSYPIVLKADGLAAGKGVIIAHSLEEAVRGVDHLHGGAANFSIVIEDFIAGEEASYIVLCDGLHTVSLASAQDHKTRDDHDKGPNTGGMGAYSPAPIITPEIETRILDEVIRPTMAGMAAAGTPFHGFLFAGLMITPDGDLRVLEFNVRLGDPETQVILSRLQSDFLTLCLACVEQRLDQITLTWQDGVALGVVMAAGGYPDDYRRGDRITGLDAPSDDGVHVFHAGTTLDDKQHVITHGGRVLCVTALAPDKPAAFNKAYARVNTLHWPNAFYRRDIGYRHDVLR